MSRAAHRFTAREVSRLMRAVEAQGKSVVAVRVEKDGSIVAVIGDPTKDNPSHEGNEWDRA